jgi:hypothetical protein
MSRVSLAGFGQPKARSLTSRGFRAHIIAVRSITPDQQRRVLPLPGASLLLKDRPGSIRDRRGYTIHPGACSYQNSSFPIPFWNRRCRLN